MNYTIVAPQPLQALIAHRLSHSGIRYQLNHCSDDHHPTSLAFVTTSPADTPATTYQTDIEFLALPTPQAPEHGFILAAAGSISALQRSTPLLDTLAPIAQGWLHIGDIGAAHFAAQIWQILLGSNTNPADFLPFWQNTQRHFTQQTPNQAELIASLAQQTQAQAQQCQDMQHLATAFLLRHPEHAFTPYHPQQRSFFGPYSETHISPAHQLAKLIMLLPIQPETTIVPINQ
ncbi:hypothetical protein [uncultured Deefgea sp.]|uniref:hypothetical protein n=1 Tax=uncultured Deefgea sp. TaxID=1304914 RepID=UPI0026101B62|nr:hypothetical protein [uncultured Deefgea sp.]